MLEASLRKLVREEAATAAIETLERVGVDIAKAVKCGTAEALLQATAAIDKYRAVTWSPEAAPSALVAAQAVTINGDDKLLCECRTKALELAISASDAGADPALIVAHAAMFAAFILDGTPHVGRKAAR